MQYILYARRSCKEKSRQIRSIPDQLAWGDAIAKQRGLTISKTFTDKQSAKEPGREGFADMMAWIHKAKEPVGILTWKTSRLARNPIDEGMVKYAFIQGKIGHIIAKDREFRTGENQILMGVEFGAATQFSLELSSDVRRGMEAKVKNGWMPCPAPIGYINDPAGQKGDRKIFPDPERFEMIQDMWKLLLTGSYTVPHILQIANEEWGFRTRRGKPLSRSTLYSVFSKPFYAGAFEWNGKLHQGKHQPMITWTEYEKAQTILGDRGKPIRAKHHHLYTGLFRCGECGGMVTAESPKKKVNEKKGQVRVYHYLRCSKKKAGIRCSQKYLRVEHFEKQVTSLLSRVQLSPEFVAWAKDQLASEKAETKRKLGRRKRENTLKLNETEHLLDQLTEKFLKGSISEEAYQSQYQRYRKEQLRLSDRVSQKAQLRKNNTQRNRRLDQWSSLVPSFQIGTREEKHTLLKHIGSNLRMKDGKVLLDWLSPFDVFQNTVKGEQEVFGRLEPSKKGLNKLSEGDLNRLIPVWYATLNAIRNYFESESY